MARLNANGVEFDLLDPSNVINSFYWQYPAGTKKVFFQATAPTGWTQDTSQNNKALRLVNGVGGGNGGSRSFTSTLFGTADLSVDIDQIFPVVNASVGNHTLSISKLPNHTHQSYFGPAGGANATPFSNTGARLISGSTITGTMVPAGGGGAHNHPFSGSVDIDTTASLDVDLAVTYVDVILCRLN